ncbi:MAG: Arm DNA-binding domain-containing protein, partial [Desulfovibrio sp.]|nr:Arm DNA-binding domain-containing protein [Desulfovibrio sp.]
MLSDKAVAQAKPKKILYRIADQNGSGLCLEIPPTGGKRWRFRYRHQGKAKMISLGTYPLVSLKEARDKAWEAKKEVSQGVDPSVKRRL